MYRFIKFTFCTLATTATLFLINNSFSTDVDLKYGSINKVDILLEESLTLFNLQLYEEAEEKLEIANHLQPYYSLTHFMLAEVLRQRGKMVEAIKEYRMTIKLDPFDSRAKFRLGTALFEVGEDEKGIRMIREASKLNPLDKEFLDSLKRYEGQIERKNSTNG